ncbi:MAG: hypothetical protein ACYDAS_02430 [Patescibacteria group bacterium]
MNKKYIISGLVFIYIVITGVLIYFILYQKSHPVYIYNVEKPLTSNNNIYRISLDEQIMQNLNTIRTAFLSTPRYNKLHISSVSSFTQTSINGVKGSVPSCYPVYSNASNKCTPLSSIYPQIQKHLSNISIDFSSPHSLSNYYVVLYNNHYYFLDINYRHTIQNNGFPVIYVES